MKALRFERKVAKFAAAAIAGRIVPGLGAKHGPLCLDDIDVPGLPGADWVALLPQPLAEVRRQLQVAPLSPYKPLRVSDLPGGKLPPV